MPERRSPSERYGEDAAEYRRPPAGRRPEPPRGRADRRARPDWDAEARGTSGRSPRGELRTGETGGSRLRGIVAVAAVFLLTLAACGVESFIGSGLGIGTTIALVGSAALAALLVRRRDLVSVVVAPPLIFAAVAAIDVAAAPSATFSLTTLATVLIRGFPAMGIATGLALVVALCRWAARR
jgi:hypothetical protein